MLLHGLVETSAPSNCVSRLWLLPEICSEAALLLASVVSGAWHAAPTWLMSSGVRIVLKKESLAGHVTVRSV